MALVTRSTKHKKEADISRGGLIDTTPVEGNVTTVKDAKFVSLVSHPANQTPVRIVRSDTTNEGAQVSKPTAVRRRIRRSDQPNPVLRLAFPTNYDEADVAESLKKFGMDDYRVENVEGVFLATRSDLKSIATKDTVTIKLDSEGVTATVARSDALMSATSGLRLAGLEFSGEHFSTESAAAWMADKKIDIPGAQTENSDGSCVVTRSDVKEGEVRRMELDTGVIAVIVQAETTDLPAAYADIITETAYGCWGWGHIDFASALADVEFSRAIDDSIYRLGEVLRNILFYSDLPLDVRKTLVDNAGSQFSDFISSLMDSLPRVVVAAVARSDKTTSKESTMTKPTDQAPAAAPEATNTQTAPAETTVQRADLTVAVTPENANEEVTITRSQLAEFLANGAAAALATQRKDTTIPAGAGAAAATAEQQAAQATPAATPAATPPADGAVTISRADLKSLIDEATKPLAEKLDKFENMTIVRSDNTDGTNPDGKPVERNIWRGSLIGQQK